MKLKEVLRFFYKESKNYYEFFKSIVISDKYKEDSDLDDKNSWLKMKDNYGIPEEDNIIIPELSQRVNDDVYKSGIFLELRFINDCIAEFDKLTLSNSEIEKQEIGSNKSREINSAGNEDLEKLDV